VAVVLFVLPHDVNMSRNVYLNVDEVYYNQNWIIGMIKGQLSNLKHNTDELSG